MSTNPWTKLLDIKRAGVTERTIFGSVAVANGERTLTADSADPQIFGRSLMKPFQIRAIAGELEGLLSSEEKALALASHNGTDQHVKVAQQILKEDAWKLLKLPEASPMQGDAKDKSVWFNPCSGKHSAILRACQAAGWPTENYLSVDHPYNLRFVETVERVIGKGALKDRKVAPDGCQLPTYAMAVTELAKLFKDLAVTHDKDWIWSSYHAHPDLIGGKDRLDTLLLGRLPNVLSKEGADGLLGLAVVDPRFPDGLGVILKIAHGRDTPILWHLAYHLMSEIGYEVPEPPALAGQELVFSPALANLFK